MHLDFFHLDWDMGRYAAFVWPAYGLALAGLAALIAVSLRVNTQRKTRLKALEEAAGAETGPDKDVVH
ncbi:MAG: heme exporter protein CcmD [Asticcacaulis sp.]|nr:heme exporter protein CcmD [Asticcacaulis sp.]